jgi:hypothetical protein
MEMKRYEVLCNRHFAKVEEYERERTKLFRMIIGQCSPTLRDKLESMKEYPALEAKDDFLGLLKLIHSLVYGTDKGQYQYWKMQVAMAKLASMKQEPWEPTMSFAERFLTQVEATESLWGILAPSLDRAALPVLEEIDNEDDQARLQRLEQWKSSVQEWQNKLVTSDKEARDKFLACLFLACTDRERYKEVIDDLGNDFSLGNINYPEDVSGMVSLLTNRRGLKTARSKQLEDIQDGVLTSFQQAQSHPKLRCRYCGMKGHVTEVCYKRLEDEEKQRKTGISNTQGWFDDLDDLKGVSSFQYEEARAWFHEEDSVYLFRVISVPILLGIAQWNRRSVLAGYGTT